MAAVAEPVPPVNVARRRRSQAVKRPRETSPVRARVEYVALRAAIGVLATLPLSVALRVGELGALIAYLVASGPRRVGTINLRIAFPEKPAAERRRILRASFLNLGRMAAEMAHFPTLTAAELLEMVRFDDEAAWQGYVDQSKELGGLVLSGHFGNWELLVFSHGMRRDPVTMVYRAVRNPLIERWLESIRRRAGTRLIQKSHASTGVLRALREHRLLVLPFDQNSTRALGIFVDFFGRPASTNVGIARLALRTGAPVLPVFLVRQGRSARHVAYALPPMYAERTGNPAADVDHNTARFSAVFEDMIRRYPEQWLWMHKRWKTRPEGEARIY
jgi:KDO2-lipid IV(A) lauroyltransferase